MVCFPDDVVASDRDPRVEENGWKPRQCVWELTLACDQHCTYCGSRAGCPRPAEMDTRQCLGVVDQLAALGCELVSLSGGEPTLREDWDEIARACSARGMQVNMVTHGVYRSQALRRDIVARCVAAGLCNVGVSLDGPEPVHDGMRGKGTWREAASSIRLFADGGIPVVVMTTVSRINLPHLEETLKHVAACGGALWRLQLAKPMGKLAARTDIVLEPRQIVELIDTLTRLKHTGVLPISVGDSIGYYGPEGDCLRSGQWRGRKEHWHGCQAGMRAIGIEAHGAIKGCLSLQAGQGPNDPFVEGNLQDSPLEVIWSRKGAFSFNRDFRVENLRGACRRCRLARTCRGGAACVASAVHGRLGDNPYCYHRWTAVERASAPLSRQLAATAATMLTLGLANCGGTVTTGEQGVTGGSGGAGDAAADVQAQVDAASSVDASAADATQDIGKDALQEVDATEEYDCTAINCYAQLDYGTVPPAHDVFVACCCKNVCCLCDYGPDPPAGCCP